MSMPEAANNHDRRRNATASAGVAYLLQVFPKYSETFILNELLEHQRQGRPLRVLSLRLPREGRFHGCLAEMTQAAEYVAESVWESPRKLCESAWGAVRSAPRGTLRAWSSEFRRSVAFRDIWQAMLVRRWAQRRGIRHLHVHFGGYAARCAYFSRLMGGPSYSVTLHAFDIFRDDVDLAVLRRIVESSAFCVTVSRFNAGYLEQKLGAAAARVRVLYNGIPLTRFPYSNAVREPGTILSVGRLIEKKGFLDLIRACRALRDRNVLSNCSIVGEGPQRDELSAEIKRLGLGAHVRLVGAWPQEKVADELRRAQVFALPCVEARDGNMDALPTVLLEAMASGCPVVSTRLSGIPEIVDNGAAGLLVNPGDVAGLAAAIEILVKEPAVAERFSRTARVRIETHFNIANAVSKLGDWLCEAAPRERSVSSASAGSKASGSAMNADAALPIRTVQEAGA